MLSKLKSYLTIASLVIAVLGSGYGFIQKVRADKEAAARFNAETELKVKTTEVVTYKNKLGQTVTKTLEYERELNDLKNSNDSLELRIYKTVKASKIKEKDLTEALAIAYKTEVSEGVLQEEILPLDSITNDTVLTFNDGFLDLEIKQDSIAYSYSDSIVAVKSKRRVERKFFLWRWLGIKKRVNKEYIEISSTNPNSKLKGRLIKLND